jgi:hypothetical protein
LTHHSSSDGCHSLFQRRQLRWVERTGGSSTESYVQYIAPITYSFITHQTRDPIPAEASYHASWITSKCSSIGTVFLPGHKQLSHQHRYRRDIYGRTSTNEPLAGANSTTQACTSNHPWLSISTFRQDFLYTGAQFYRQSERSQKEHATHQQRAWLFPRMEQILGHLK